MWHTSYLECACITHYKKSATMKSKLFLRMGGYAEVILGIAHIAGIFFQPESSPIPADYQNLLNLSGASVGILLTTMGMLTFLMLKNGNNKSIENITHCQSALWACRVFLEFIFPATVPVNNINPAPIVMLVITTTMLLFLFSSIFTLIDSKKNTAESN